MGKHIYPEKTHTKDESHMASGVEGEAETGEDKPGGTSQVDINKLLEKYGKLQNNPLLLTEDGKKLYQKEGFRIRFRLSRAYRGLEKQEIIASRPEVSNLNGKKRRKELQRLMEELEQNLMLFDPDEEAKKKAKEREEERLKLLKECRENAEKKWNTDPGDQQKSNTNNSRNDFESRSPSRISQYMAEYWGSPTKNKKGKPPKGDWRIRNKGSGGKPWWHNFTKKKKPRVTWGANVNVTDGKTTPLKVMKTDDKKEGDEAEGENKEENNDTEKFFVTNSGSDRDSYSAVSEWQRRNAERKMGKMERSRKLKIASHVNKQNKLKKNGQKQTASSEGSDSNNGNLNGGLSELEESKGNKLEVNHPKLEKNAALSGSRSSLAANKDSTKSKEGKDADVGDVESEAVEFNDTSLAEKAKYSFMGMEGLSSEFKSCASSMTSASSNRSGSNTDVLDRARLDLLLRVKGQISGGSRAGSYAGSHAGSRTGSHADSHAGSKAGSSIPAHKVPNKTGDCGQRAKDSGKKTVSVQKAVRKSVSFRHADDDSSSQGTNDNAKKHVIVHSRGPGIEITPPELPGQISPAKHVDSTSTQKPVGAGILKDSVTPPKVRRVKSASAVHAPKPRISSARTKDDSNVPELHEAEKPLKTCRYMYTMCNCQRVGKPNTLYKLQQRRKKTVGVITVFGCPAPGEEENTRPTSPTICPFCSVFPRRRIGAWLKDVPVVVVD